MVSCVTRSLMVGVASFSAIGSAEYAVLSQNPNTPTTNIDRIRAFMGVLRSVCTYCRVRVTGLITGRIPWTRNLSWWLNPDCSQPSHARLGDRYFRWSESTGQYSDRQHTP